MVSALDVLTNKSLNIGVMVYVIGIRHLRNNFHMATAPASHMRELRKCWAITT